jgi:hypothetical protein
VEDEAQVRDDARGVERGEVVVLIAGHRTSDIDDLA